MYFQKIKKLYTFVIYLYMHKQYIDKLYITSGKRGFFNIYIYINMAYM